MGNYLRARLIGCAAVVVILILIAVGVAVYEGVVSMMHASAAAPFKPHLAEYLAPAADSNHTAPVRGKLVVLDRKTQDLDWDVVYDLPADLKATRHEEVGAVVWVDYDRKPGDLVYGNENYPSYVQTGRVTVVDLATHSVIGTAAFQGGPPPSDIDEHAREGVGSKPTQEIVAYLKGLPRQ